MKRYLVLSILLSSLLVASDDSIDNLFDMSLEELMNVEVTTVSQEKEKASESLSVVTVITATQLKQMGALNLYEALSYVPGIEINETYMGYTVLTFRGLTPGLYNNKALFMINGHPVHEKLFGSSHLEFIPLDMVERIEVVRSPSSVLYGTNAISGVVNVITKQGKEFSNSTVFRVGSNDHYYGSLNIHDTHISMGASYQSDDGYDFGGTRDELNQYIDKDYKNNLRNIFIDAYGEQWRLQGAYYRSEKEKLGLNPIIQHGGINDFEAFYLDLNKAFTIGDGTLNVWLRYDKMERDLDANQFPDPYTGGPVRMDNSVERYSAEVQYKDTLFNNLDYIVGVSAEFDKTDPALFLNKITNETLAISPIRDSQDTDNFALYSQAKYKFSDKLVGIAGFRFEDNSDTNSAINPRIGLNYEYVTDTYFKLLYSEAYRSPAFIEKYADVPGILLGDKDLDREKIRTLEFGVESALNKQNSIQVTSYYSQLDDEITRKTSILGGSQYYNADTLKMYGLEFALNSIVNDKIEVMFNASYVNGEREDGSNIEFIAHKTANIMLTYHLSSQWSSTFSDQYISSKDYTTTSGESGEIDDYNLANITVSYINRPFEVNLYLKNIFDESYTYPEPVRKNISEIPGGAGISTYLTLRYYF